MNTTPELRPVDLEILTVAVYPRIGGMTSWIDQVAHGLAGMGWKVRLIGFSDAWSADYNDAPFEAVHIRMPAPAEGILAPWDKWRRWREVHKTLRHWQARQPPPRLRLSDSTPGILHTAHKISQTDGAPWVVLAGGDIFAETSESRIAGPLQAQIRRGLNQARRIFVDGSDLIDSLAGHGVRRDLLAIQYHGVESDRFLPRPGPPQFFPEGTSLLRVAWHGKHADYNGPLRFIDLAAKAEGILPRLAGDGPQRGAVTRRLEALHHPEWWLGPLPVRDVGKFLSEAGAGIYPLSAMAGVPRVLLESMAAGLATLTYDVGIARDLIRQGENGFICRDEHEMLAALHQVRSDPALRKRIGEAAREAIRKDWTVEATLQSFAKALEAVRGI
jgi:glycosyltransferase involved in cell wall biosynthesis